MQCQFQTSRGPCGNPCKSGSTMCRVHAKDAAIAEAYRISDPDLQDSLHYHAKASLLDISQQIVLLRGLIERRLNMSDGSDADKIAAYNFVASQLTNLTKMTETMVKLAKESGELMERGDVEGLVDKLVGIVASELKDLPDYEQIIDKIVSRIDEIQ